MGSSKQSIKMTVREIRSILFDTDKYTVIEAEELTNKESRDVLYNMVDQNKVYSVIDNGSHLLIY